MLLNDLTYSESSINSTACDFIPKRKSKVLSAAGKIIKLKIHKFRGSDFMSFLKPVNKKLAKMCTSKCSKKCDTEISDSEYDSENEVIEEISEDEVSYINVRTQQSEEEGDFDGDIQGICVLSATRVALTDSYNRKVKLVDTTKFKVISELWVAGRPWEIAKLAISQGLPATHNKALKAEVQSQIAVTLPHNKQILLLSVNDDTLKLHKHIPARGECWGIVALENSLIISYQSPCCIKIISLDGKVIKSIIKETEAMRLFISPKHLDISLDHTTIYVSDSGKNTLTSFPINGNTSKLNIMVGLSGAAGICAGKDNSVYMCDFADSCVLYYALNDPSQTEHSGFSTDKNKPISVAVCYETDRLYIGMWKKDMIRVERLSATTYHKLHSSFTNSSITKSLTKSTSSSSSLSMSLTTSLTMSSSPALFNEQLLLEEYRHTWS